MRCLERYAPAYRNTLSETFEGTAMRAGYVFEYCASRQSWALHTYAALKLVTLYSTLISDIRHPFSVSLGLIPKRLNSFRAS